MKMLGFTGTCEGMTSKQLKKVKELIEMLEPESVAHGCAIGADRQFHGLTSGIPRHLYPCNGEQMRWAQANASLHDHLHNIEEPLERNQIIVGFAEQMIATPAERQEQRRSGTWYTIRYALKAGRRLHICWPDGTVATPQQGDTFV